MNKTLKFNGYCRMLLPHAFVECKQGYTCDYCDLGVNIRLNKSREELDKGLLFTWRDAISQTGKYGCADWYKKVIILKPEAMRRAGIPVNLINQLFYAVGGSGVFKHNPSGMIDGYPVLQIVGLPSSFEKKEYTFFRNDFYGVPNEAAVKMYESLYKIKINLT